MTEKSNRPHSENTMIPSGESGVLTLTKKQAEQVRVLLHTELSEVALSVGDVCGIEDLERSIADAQELLVLWRALDGGTLTLTPGLRRLLERGQEFLESMLLDAEQALERVRAGEGPFGGTVQAQEAYVLAYLDDVIDELSIVRELLFAAEHPGLADSESAVWA